MPKDYRYSCRQHCGNNGYPLRTASISPIPPPPAPAPHLIAPVDEVGSVGSLERTDHHSHQYRVGLRTAEGIHVWRVVRTFFGVTRHASLESLRQLTYNCSAVGASSKIYFDYDSHGDSQVQRIVRATQPSAMTPCHGLGYCCAPSCTIVPISNRLGVGQHR